MQNPVLATLAAHRIIPVIVLKNAEAAEPLGEALVASGLPVAEVTLRTPAAQLALRTLAANPSLTVGAGTVLTQAQVNSAADAGARFIVSPGISAQVVRRCQQLDIQVIPGISTATELMTALDLGVSVVKFFPAEASGGIGTLSALAGPFPAVRFVPTGGIDASIVQNYLAHAAVLAVGGSWMVPPQAIDSGDVGRLKDLLEACRPYAVAGAGT